MTVPTYDFKNLRPLLDKAEITIEEAATIFKTSKVTVYSWCEGRGPNQPALLERTERLISILGKAVESKALPLVDVEKHLRMGKLMEVLRKHLNGGA